MQVFISYKRQDQPFAEDLHGLLQAWGHTPWLDVRDIAPDDNWDDAIHDGLKDSQVIVGILAPESLASPNVLDEWGWAVTNNRRLILLWLRDIHEEDMSPRFIRKQRIDLRQDDKKLELLRRALASPTAIVPDDTPQAAAPVHKVKRADKNEVNLLNNVHDSWITGVLEPSLRGRSFALGLGMKRDAVLKHVDFGDFELTNTESIEHIFADLQHELLILGAPGAGKTILLLQLADALVKRALEDATAPMPVIFNLSGWAREQKSLEDWLQQELVARYQVPKRTARRWLADERLILLLDGLDEVDIEYRDACVQAINDFRDKYRTVNMAVCSRIADYEMLTNRLNLRAAIELQALTLEQVDEQLAENDEFDSLREAIHHNSALQAMSEVPFLLNSMLFTYRGATHNSLATEIDETAARRNLFDQMVKRRFEAPSLFQIPRTLSEKIRAARMDTDIWTIRAMQIVFFVLFGFVTMLLLNEAITPPDYPSPIITVGLIIAGSYLGAIFPYRSINAQLTKAGVLQPGKKYSLAQIRRRLAFIASRLHHSQETIFYIADVQPDWLPNQRLHLIYRVLYALILAVFGVIFFVPLGAFSLFIFGAANSSLLFSGMFVIGIAVGLLHALLTYKHIRSVDRFVVTRSRAVVSLVGGLLLGVFLFTAFRVDTLDPFNSLSDSIIVVLCYGLIPILMVAGFIGSQPRADVSRRVAPTSGLSESIAGIYVGTFGWAMSLVLTIIIPIALKNELMRQLREQGVTAAMVLEQSTVWMLGLGVGVIGIALLLAYFPYNRMLALGGATLFKNAIVMLLLQIRGDAPRNYMKFMDFCVQKGLVRRVGGGYIFIHRMMLEYFAESYTTYDPESESISAE